MKNSSILDMTLLQIIHNFARWKIVSFYLETFQYIAVIGRS